MNVFRSFLFGILISSFVGTAYADCDDNDVGRYCACTAPSDEDCFCAANTTFPITKKNGDENSDFTIDEAPTDTTHKYLCTYCTGAGRVNVPGRKLYIYYDNASCSDDVDWDSSMPLPVWKKDKCVNKPSTLYEGHVHIKMILCPGS